MVSNETLNQRRTKEANAAGGMSVNVDIGTRAQGATYKHSL
jgi:hypothetical protein